MRLVLTALFFLSTLAFISPSFAGCQSAPQANAYWGKTCYVYSKNGRDYYSTKRKKNGKPVFISYPSSP